MFQLLVRHGGNCVTISNSSTKVASRDSIYKIIYLCHPPFSRLVIKKTAGRERRKCQDIPTRHQTMATGRRRPTLTPPDRPPTASPRLLPRVRRLRHTPLLTAPRPLPTRHHSREANRRRTSPAPMELLILPQLPEVTASDLPHRMIPAGTASELLRHPLPAGTPRRGLRMAARSLRLCHHSSRRGQIRASWRAFSWRTVTEADSSTIRSCRALCLRTIRASA